MAGGAAAIRRLIDCSYDRVDRDQLLSPFFPGGVSEDDRAHVGPAVGGARDPARYSEEPGGYQSMLAHHRNTKPATSPLNDSAIAGSSSTDSHGDLLPTEQQTGPAARPALRFAARGRARFAYVLRQPAARGPDSRLVYLELLAQRTATLSTPTRPNTSVRTASAAMLPSGWDAGRHLHRPSLRWWLDL
jgi:hypothetical protein